MTKIDFYQSIVHSYQNAYADDPILLEFIDRVLSFLPPQAHTLDVGCGTGKPLDMVLASAGHNVKGIDISPTMVKISRENVPSGTFHTADMCTYEWPTEEPLDAVFNVRALFNHDRKDIEGCVQKWGSWLHSGGLLCLVVLAADDYDPAKFEGGYDPDGLCARVRRRFMGSEDVNTLFTYVGWRKLLRANGLEIVNEKMGVFVPPEGTDSDEAPQYCIIARKV